MRFFPLNGFRGSRKVSPLSAPGAALCAALCVALCAILLTGAEGSPLPQDMPIAHLEDDSALRLELRDRWFTQERDRVLSKGPEIKTLKSGSRVQVRVETGAEEFSVVLAREWKGSAGELAYIVRQTGSSWPGWTQGSWSLTRRRDDGSPLRIRIFPRTDPNMYIQLNPFSEKDKCTMDVVVYGAYCIQGLSLAISFEDLYTAPLGDILALAGPRFPRRYFEPLPPVYRDERELIKKIRAALPGLSYRDDGAIDEYGRYVFIKDLELQNGDGRTGGLNCSGFAKWVTDGILLAAKQARLPIAPLKEEHFPRGSSFTEPYEELREPFFGLDWTRNLAGFAGALLRSPEFAALEEIEVRNWPFLNVIIRGNQQGGNSPSGANGKTVVPYPGFLLNAGFGFEGLQPLLYTLAVDEPGYIYLASVNREMNGPPERSKYRALTLRQHFHIAVLVPYFNEYGNFQAAVFESAEETNFTAFRTRYPGAFVNLVRIPIEGSFEP